ncbi:MAG: sodium-dependent transporter [Proteobacteria bacterium]|nr:sodium-dependent transporter [Pseudomonadota bacterium]
MEKSDVRPQWSSRMPFIFAAVGSAVGLGNIWRFPYMAGENGGAAFVLIYVAFVVLIGLPVLIAELTIGRRGRMSPITSIRNVAEESNSSKRWGWIGHLSSLGGGLGLLAFYSVIAGWVLAYIIKAGSGMFLGFTAADSAAALDELYASTPVMAFWHFVFIAVTVYIVGKGINAGLEKAVTYLMPVLFLLLLMLAGYSMATGEFLAALHYLFAPDFSKLTGEVVLNAVGQAFFSLSLALGTMVAYGAYLPKSISIHRSATLIAAADTGVALIAGMAIFPLVFAYGLNPGSGPDLIFKTLPIAFGQMPGGAIFGMLFFILLAIAAVTSSISMLEPAVAYFEERQDMNRWKSAIFGGGIAFLIGLLTVFTQNDLAEFHPLASFGIEMDFFQLNNFIVSNLIMPIGALLLAIFVGWQVKRNVLRDELGLPEGGIFAIWHVLIKFFCPVAIIAILISGLA